MDVNGEVPVDELDVYQQLLQRLAEACEAADPSPDAPDASDAPDAQPPAIIVAEAHGLTMRALEPTIFAKFVSFGYVRTQHTHLMKKFTMPDDYKYTKKDEVIKQFQDEALEAARPAPALVEPPSSCPSPHSLLLTTLSIRHC